MKARVFYAAAGILALSAFVAAVSSEPTQAQSGGRWVPVEAYDTEAGGEVWMIDPDTGMARNCFWYERREIRCANSQRY